MTQPTFAECMRTIHRAKGTLEDWLMTALPQAQEGDHISIDAVFENGEWRITTVSSVPVARTNSDGDTLPPGEQWSHDIPAEAA